MKQFLYKHKKRKLYCSEELSMGKKFFITFTFYKASNRAKIAI